LAIRCHIVNFDLVKRKLLICGIILLMHSICIGQITRISDQPKLTQKRTQFHRAIGAADGHILMLSYGDDRMSNGFVLERYTESLGFVNDRKFEVPSKQIVLKVFLADSVLYWISATKIKRSSIKVSIYSVSASLLGEIQNKEIGTYHTGDIEIDQFEVVNSPNRRNWAILSFGTAGQRVREALGTEVWVLASNIDGGQIQSRFTLASERWSPSDLVWKSVVMDDSARVFAIFEDKDYGGSSFLGVRKQSNHYHWVKYVGDSTNLGDLVVDGEVLDATVVLHTSSQAISIFGYYNAGRGVGMDGYFLGAFGVDNKIACNNYPFSESAARQFIGLGSLKRNERPDNYYIRNVVALSNGGWLLLSEQFYESRQMETYYVNGVPQTSSKLFYHYGDIALQYLKKDGSLDSLIMVRKTQVGAVNVSHLFGFGMYVCGSSVNLLYNDDEGEINRIMHVKVDKTYKLERDWLFRNENTPGTIVPYEGKQTDYGLITLPIYRDKQWFWLQVFSND